jgi:hypothetical protein
MHHEPKLASVRAKRKTNPEPATGELQPLVLSTMSSARIRPDFFIVGAPKCGTSALVEYLSHHPDIYMARKEMHFFGSDLRFGSQIYRRDRNAYRSEFDTWNGQSRAGEASVWYLFSTRAAAEIKEFNPHSRIIIMLREPAEMLYSLYHQFLFDGNEHLPTFREALAAEEDRRAGRKITRLTYLSQALIYHEVAGFTEQIRRYFDLFGREQVHIVVYDDFVADTGVAYGRVLDFLGVDSTQIPDSFKVINGGAKSVRTPVLRGIMGDPLVRGTAIAMRSWLPRPLFRALQKIDSQFREMNVRCDEHPQIDPDLRELL